MEKPLDRITEAYFYKMGETFGRKVRERIHWICENAAGESILDVGCSQGIVSILLAREGKKVIGLDVAEEAIAYANEFLANESPLTRQNVQFVVANFKTHVFEEDAKFDTIIFGEIFEHFFDPQAFMKKALELLAPGGKIIVTVPFGINDYFDHKKTFYMRDLFQLAGSDFSLIEMKPMGKWIGAIYKRKQDEPAGLEVNDELLGLLEQSFYLIERELLDALKKKDKLIESYEKKLEKQDNLAERIAGLEKNLMHGISEMAAKFEAVSREHDRLSNAVHAERMHSEIRLKKELAEAYAREEHLLKQLKQTEERLKALRQSKFGRLAVFYWKLRKKLRG